MTKQEIIERLDYIITLCETLSVVGDYQGFVVVQNIKKQLEYLKECINNDRTYKEDKIY